LVCMTTMVGFEMAPVPFDFYTFSTCVTGTALASASAAAFNQYIEIQSDSNMKRTSNRPLVQKLLTPLHACIFASGTGLAGIALLYTTVNTLTAGLALTNILLYVCCYTPMKKVSMYNTWVGAIVGAIPPLMGWTAATGGISDLGFLVLTGILFSWQLPHFNALSWSNKMDYSKAGYKMMASVDPLLCRRVALRHTIITSLFTILAPMINLTNVFFPLIMSPVNLYFVLCGYQFYKNGDSKSAKKLFRASLIHLPLCLVALILTKQKIDKSYPNVLKNILEPFTIRS
ncbi:hypothetical protein A3Q56_07560, partial [Intoshia linei]